MSVLINKISALRKVGEHKKAIEYCDIILNINPNYNVVLYHKERILQSIGRYKESILCCDKILKDYPENGDVLFDKSTSLALLEKFNESISNLEKAIRSGNQFKIKAQKSKAFEKLLSNQRFQKLVS